VVLIQYVRPKKGSMTKEYSLEWAKLLQARGEGKQLQMSINLSNGIWIDMELDGTALMDSDPRYWRIKPELVLKPWKLDPKYIGRVVKNKSTGDFTMIVGISKRVFCLGSYGNGWKPKLLMNFWDNLDGSPCGEME